MCTRTHCTYVNMLCELLIPHIHQHTNIHVATCPYMYVCSQFYLHQPVFLLNMQCIQFSYTFLSTISTCIVCYLSWTFCDISCRFLLREPHSCREVSICPSVTHSFTHILSHMLYLRHTHLFLTAFRLLVVLICLIRWYALKFGVA